MWNEKLNNIDQHKTPILAASLWCKNVNKVKLVSKGINLVYSFMKVDCKYYLRLTHADLRLKKELEAAIAYQKHLFEHEAPICKPIKSLNNLWFESIWQGEEEFIAHVCKEVPGQPITFEYNNLNLYATWGVALGKLHKAALLYNCKKYNYTSWEESITEMEGYAKNEENAVKDSLRNVSQFLKNRKKTSVNYGLTHGDHREGNVLTDGRQIHIIDFDLPSHNWFTEDVFRPFFDSIINDKLSFLDKINPYLDGYLSIMPKDSIDLEAFPWQIQMKCLEIYLWTKNNWSDESAPGGNNTREWLNNIYNKIINTDWFLQIKY